MLRTSHRLRCLLSADPAGPARRQRRPRRLDAARPRRPRAAAGGRHRDRGATLAPLPTLDPEGQRRCAGEGEEWVGDRHKSLSSLGVARFIDASIYRDTFPAISIVILFIIITIGFLVFYFFFYNDFHLGKKDT